MTFVLISEVKVREIRDALLFSRPDLAAFLEKALGAPALNPVVGPQEVMEPGAGGLSRDHGGGTSRVTEYPQYPTTEGRYFPMQMPGSEMNRKPR